MMAAIILLLLGLLVQAIFGVAVVETSETPPNADAVSQSESAGVIGDLMPVERVEVRVLESFPVQVQAEVFGFLPDSCTQLGEISQTREGNAVVVTILTIRPPDAFCSQVITPVDETIALEGDFPTGSYTVTVNGVTESFQV